MTRPNNAIIGPFRWEILYDAYLLKEAQHMDGEGRFGITRPEKIDIVVDPERPERAIAETLLHEVLHACAWTYGVDWGNAAEESVIAPLSSAVLDMMRRNPVMMHYLIEESAL